MYVAVRHDNRQRVLAGRGAGRELVWRSANKGVSAWKSFCRCESRSRIGDGYQPPDILCEMRERLRIVPGAEYDQMRWRDDRFKVNSWVCCASDPIRNHIFVQEARSKRLGILGVPSHSQLRRLSLLQVSGDRIGPSRPRREALDEHLDDPVAAQSDTPDQVILRSCVINNKLCQSGRRGLPGPCQDILFQAAPAHRPDPGAVIRDQKPCTRAAVGRAFDGHQGCQHGLGARPG